LFAVLLFELYIWLLWCYLSQYLSQNVDVVFEPNNSAQILTFTFHLLSPLWGRSNFQLMVFLNCEGSLELVLKLFWMNKFDIPKKIKKVCRKSPSVPPEHCLLVVLGISYLFSVSWLLMQTLRREIAVETFMIDLLRVIYLWWRHALFQHLICDAKKSDNVHFENVLLLTWCFYWNLGPLGTGVYLLSKTLGMICLLNYYFLIIK